MFKEGGSAGTGRDCCLLSFGSCGGANHLFTSNCFFCKIKGSNWDFRVCSVLLSSLQVSKESTRATEKHIFFTGLLGLLLLGRCRPYLIGRRGLLRPRDGVMRLSRNNSWCSRTKTTTTHYHRNRRRSLMMKDGMR